MRLFPVRDLWSELTFFYLILSNYGLSDYTISYLYEINPP